LFYNCHNSHGIELNITGSLTHLLFILAEASHKVILTKLV